MSEARAHESVGLGDFQTPVELARAVWRSLDLDDVTHIVEPTVGIGNFVAAAPDAATSLPWLAFDLNAAYIDRAAAAARRRGVPRFSAACRDAFGLTARDLAACGGDSVPLVVGNPPWVTNASLGRIRGRNTPAKWNRANLSGLDAMTGKSNFDIAEAILLAVLDGLCRARGVRVALLLKRSVALKMAQNMMRSGGATAMRFSAIDAHRWFGAAVDAGLFELTWSPRASKSAPRIVLRESLGGPDASASGYVAGSFVHSLDAYDTYKHIEGRSPNDGFVWRQGVKHDLSRVLELRRTPAGLVNGLGEEVEIEAEALCPLYKSADIANGRPASRMLPLYQTDLTGPVADLQTRWPKLAAYLERHRGAFAERRSRIYAGKYAFMLFGVGEYTVAPYKVAVSGFYKRARFVLLEPDRAGRPPVVDDTCYLLPFHQPAEARAACDYLNGPDVQGFLEAITDRTAKRPYTAEVLRRIARPGSRSNSQLSLV